MTRMQRPAPGFTLVELLVALVLGLGTITLAGTGLHLARQGMLLIDQSTQLQDSERLARDVITQLVQQAGFGLVTDDPADQEPVVFGWDHAVYRKPDHSALSLIQNIRSSTHPAACSTLEDSACLQDSDILAIRTGSSPGLTHCGGGTAPVHSLSLLYVKRSDNDTSGLNCAYLDAGGKWMPPVPLIEGVESLQVLYGLQSADNTSTHVQQWAHAAAMEVAGNAAATRSNWRRVRTVRIALLLRSTSRLPSSGPLIWHPFGEPYANAAPSDTGARLNVPPDRRLRRMVQWNIHLPASRPIAP